MADDVEKIPNDNTLLRRISPIHLKSDETGKRRLTSAAFTSRQMSVDVENMMTADGRDWIFSLRNEQDHYLVRLQAGFVRGLNQTIEHQPNPPEQPDNPYHAEVIGSKSTASKKLRGHAEWVKKPEDVD